MRIKIICIFLILTVTTSFLCSCGAGPDKLSKDGGLSWDESDSEIKTGSGETLSVPVSDFGLELLSQCYDGKNTLISPLSVYIALSMTSGGASGQTLSQFKDLIGMDADEAGRALRNYVLTFPSDEDLKISSANSLWIRDDKERIDVKKSFLENNEKYYASDVYTADFEKADTVKSINKWISDKTDGKINEAISEINPASLLILINALTFDGKWDEPYSENAIRDGIFTDIKGTEQKIKYMSSTENIYIELDNGCGFAKPYEGGRYSFVAILPDETIEMGDFVSSLTGEKLSSALRNAVSTRVYTKTPKFTASFAIELSSALKNMGLTDVFSQDADLSNLAENQTELFIGSIIHKTYINVDGAGTEAGAVTIIDAPTSDEGEPKTVYLTRPYFYAIFDNEAGIPIFCGITAHVE